jgi:hypothetical protein
VRRGPSYVPTADLDPACREKVAGGLPMAAAHEILEDLG